MYRNRKSHLAVVENLQGRTLMTGVVLGVGEVAIDGGTQLRITGTPGNDQITVKQTSAGLVIGNTGGWTKTVADRITNIWVDGGAGNNSITLDASVKLDATIYGDGVNDTLVAGSGNNTLYGGSGKNLLQSRTGNDTLVTLGSTADTIVGGSGNDSFWTDNSAAEKITNLTAQESAGGAVHRVANYYNASSLSGGAQKISASTGKAASTSGFKEPGVDAGVKYSSFTNDPIFSSAGPSENDIFQGSVGDCYYLSVLSSTGKIDPNRIRQSILNLGDGTVIVQLYKGGKSVFVHEDMLLPSNDGSTLFYASLGSQNSTWVALMEKAFCYIRTSKATYPSLESGWMDESYLAIGATKPVSTFSAPNAMALMSIINKALAAGESVTASVGTPPAGSGLIGSHAYTVDHVTLDSKGNVTTVTLRNPWGCDQNGNGDGYITISAAIAFKAFAGVVSAFV